MIHQIQLLVRHTMESSTGLGILSFALIVVPIIGMDMVHRYGWQHWEPFAKHHKECYNYYYRDVAQFGRALALGASGRRFKSYRPDLKLPLHI